MTASGPDVPPGPAGHTGGEAPDPGADDRLTPRALAGEASAGIARLEGYLLARRLSTEALEAGAAFGRRFSWLGPEEQRELARVFAQEHLAVRRRMLQDTVSRAGELRHEYGRRYESLRRRLVATALGAVGVVVFVMAFVARDTLH